MKIKNLLQFDNCLCLLFFKLLFCFTHLRAKSGFLISCIHNFIVTTKIKTDLYLLDAFLESIVCLFTACTQVWSHLVIGQEFASKMSIKVHLSQNALDHRAKVEGAFQLTSSLRWSLALASLSLMSLFWIGLFTIVVILTMTISNSQGKNTLVRFCCVR